MSPINFNKNINKKLDIGTARLEFGTYRTISENSYSCMFYSSCHLAF